MSVVIIINLETFITLWEKKISLAEKIIILEQINPFHFFGANDKHLSKIEKHFSDLEFVARGNSLKISGNMIKIDEAEDAIQRIAHHIERFGGISEEGIDILLRKNNEYLNQDKLGDDLILHGHNGLIIKAITNNQKKMVTGNAKNDMLFAIGPAGSGKTYTAVALAVRALKNKQVRKIILTRPAVEAGENLGFLPGDLKEKLDPYLQPLYDALRDMLSPEKLKMLLENEVIQIAPLAFMRGRTLDNAFVILDEDQNATQNQLKMFLTRMGRNAKFIITGDVTQIDLPKNQQSGLTQAINLLSGIEGIEFIFLESVDIIRHSLVKKIVNAYDNKST